MSISLSWHRLMLACPKCDAEPAITSVSVSSDGEVMALLCCVKCGMELVWKSHFTKLIANAIYADVEESLAKKEPTKKATPIRPPITPCEKVTDDLWLHALGINPNDPPQIGGVH